MWADDSDELFAIEFRKDAKVLVLVVTPPDYHYGHSFAINSPHTFSSTSALETCIILLNTYLVHILQRKIFVLLDGTNIVHSGISLCLDRTSWQRWWVSLRLRITDCGLIRLKRGGGDIGVGMIFNMCYISDCMKHGSMLYVIKDLFWLRRLAHYWLARWGRSTRIHEIWVIK